MGMTVSISELETLIGKETGVGEWVEMGQERINQFADVTEDHQFIHIDEERAKETMFGGTIAHGFLTLSMLVKLCEDVLVGVDEAKMLVNYGFDKVRFLAPVPSGSRIRASAVMKSVQVKGAGKRALVTYDITVEIEGGKRPALTAEWLSMVMT